VFSAHSALPCVNVNRKRACIWERPDLTTCPSGFLVLIPGFKIAWFECQECNNTLILIITGVCEIKTGKASE